MSSKPSPRALIRLLVPRIPLILRNALWHLLSWTDTATKWDFRAAILITTLRDIISVPRTPVARQQRLGRTDPGVSGPIWVAKTAFPAPEGGPSDPDSLLQVLRDTVDALCPTDRRDYVLPPAQPVEVEWQGYRAGARASGPQSPALTDEQVFEKLMGEVTSDATVLYFHGGAYYLMDPITHRRLGSALARASGGRVCSVRYRLAPQHTFPAGLLDALVAYLSLLHPPANALHKPVKPAQIVFAGDSAGANLAISLLLFVLQQQRNNRKVRFQGQTVAVPLPAGIAVSSPWTDISRSMPSLVRNAKYDYLPQTWTSLADVPWETLRDRSAVALPETMPAKFPSDEAWPTDPPRADFYCEASMLRHPLVSPLAAEQHLWSGLACPVFVMMGQEQLSDEIEVVVQRMARAAAESAAKNPESSAWVQLEWWEAMPHVFTELLLDTELSRVGRRRWGEWIGRAARGDVLRSSIAPDIGTGTQVEADADADAPEKSLARATATSVDASSRRSGGVRIAAKTLSQTPFPSDLTNITDITDEEVRLRMEWSCYAREAVFLKDQESIKAELEKAD